jgi:hypothetical protein
MSAFDNTLDRTNKPNGNGTQIFYFKKHYEAKHAIGKQHKKRIEFESRNGISSVESLCDYHYSTKENPLHYGRFVIRGKPKAVDALMIEIQEWINTCQQIHFNNNYW